MPTMYPLCPAPQSVIGRLSIRVSISCAFWMSAAITSCAFVHRNGQRIIEFRHLGPGPCGQHGAHYERSLQTVRKA